MSFLVVFLMQSVYTVSKEKQVLKEDLFKVYLLYKMPGVFDTPDILNLHFMIEIPTFL